MNSIGKVSVFLALLCMFSITFAVDTLDITSPNYFNEQRNTYTPIHYLSDEYLSFKFCAEQPVKTINMTLNCDNGQVKVLSPVQDAKKNTCYYSNENLDTQLTCKDFALEINYNIDDKLRTITRNFIQQKQSKLINYVLGKDYTLLSPLELSYYLVVLNDIKTAQNLETTQAYEKLKNDRDNVNKCWPSTACDMPTSAMILRNLKFAGYDSKSRLLEDGRYYLEKQMFTNDVKKSTTEYTADITLKNSANLNISCDVSLDDTFYQKYYLNKNIKTINIKTLKPTTSIHTLCNTSIDSMEYIIYDKNDNILEDNTYSSTQTSYHEILNSNSYNYPFKIEASRSWNSSTSMLTCYLYQDNLLPIKYKWYKSDNKNLLIDSSAQYYMLFTCDYPTNITLKTFTITGDKDIDNTIPQTKAYEHFFKTDTKTSFACLGLANSCSYQATANTLITYDTTINDGALLGTYTDSLLTENNGLKYIDQGTPLVDTGMYLFYKSNPDALKFLKYKQNNDGSFGTLGVYDRILDSSWAIIGLQKRDATSEYVKDGKKWIYFNEPSTGWGSIEKNTLAYLAIKEQIKPYVKMNMVNSISNTVFVLKNPTIYTLKDIKVELSKEFESYFTYRQNLGDLDGDKSITFNFTQKQKSYTPITGTLKITGLDGKNHELVLVQIPISIEKESLFTIPSGNYSVSEELGELKLKVIPSTIPFSVDCTYLNPFSKLTDKITFTEQTTELNMLALPLAEGPMSITLDCKKDTTSFSVPVSITATIAKKTFTVNLTYIGVPLSSSQDIALPITNTLTDKQTVSISVEGSLAQAVTATENSKILAAGETREVYLQITNPSLLTALGNTSDSFVVLTSNKGYSKKLPLLIIAPPASSSNKLYWYLGLGVFTFLLIIIVIRRYRMQNQESDEATAEDEFNFSPMDFK